MDIEVKKSQNGLIGEFEIPADKSVTHRAFIFSSLMNGKNTVTNFSTGQDCLSTLKMIEDLGCKTKRINENQIEIDSTNAYKDLSDKTLNCGNSGTTIRLMSGVLATRNFNATLYGDESLSKRPMRRVINPLCEMGAKIEHKDFKAPLKIYGKELSPINFKSELASAQVKSCILLAGLNTEGITTFEEPYQSRNHTELLLKYLGANIETKSPTQTSITKSVLKARDIEVIGDISSAAFFIVAALIVPNSEITIKNTGINPTRTGIIDIVKQMNGNIEVTNEREISGEKTADLVVKTSELKGITIGSEIIPRLIDELPVIAVLATQAEGKTVIKDAQDLRNKETDRIKNLVSQLKKIGADIEETPDGFIINGKKELTGGCKVETFMDHRLAMSFYIAGLVSKNPVIINNFEWVNISFPSFLQLIKSLNH